MAIFLAIVISDGKETHIRWEGHQSLDSAKSELNLMRKLMMGQGKRPFDCYVYEAETPPYGLPAYKLDDVDMNFYREDDPMNNIDMNRVLDRVIQNVKVKAGIK